MSSPLQSELLKDFRELREGVDKDGLYRTRPFYYIGTYTIMLVHIVLVCLHTIVLVHYYIGLSVY